MRTTSTDLEAVLEQIGVVVTFVGDEIVGSCPFHVDRHPSFSMNAKTGLWICYSCGEKGSLENLLQRTGRFKGNETALLREIRYKALDPKKQPQKLKETPLDPFLLYATYESFKRPPDWAAEERLISDWGVTTYGLRWAKGWIVPIWAPEYEDEVVGLWGWQWKRLHDFSNYPPKMKKSRTLFGLRELESADGVIVVESPLDVIRLAQCELPAVATFGAMISNAQLSLIYERADSVVLALDNDEEGQRQQERVYSFLAKRMRTTTVSYPPGIKDPGEMTDRQICETFA